jgi:hypothetical protein
MPLTEPELAATLETLVPTWDENRSEVSEIDRWWRNTLDDKDKPKLANRGTPEYMELRDRSSTRWLSLVVTGVAQSLYVEGYRRTDQEDNAAAWRAWQANRLDHRQSAVHRGALAHGLAYVTLFPGILYGEQMPLMRGVSARNMVAFYEDPANDEWPVYALEGLSSITAPFNQDSGRRYKLWDADAVYTVDKWNSKRIDVVDVAYHRAGVTPIVRFANELDLEGRSDGEVRPLIDQVARINQDTFDRLVVQRFGAWLLRWVAGMELYDADEDPDATEKNRAIKAKVAIEDILLFDSPDTKAGAFPATPLNGYIDARDADIRDLAAVSQTPPHHLLGHVANLSAEALAAAEAGLTRKVTERKHAFGESWEQSLRLAAHMMGDEAGAADFEAQVRWADMESRSLAQAADALVKLKDVGVPVRLLLEKIPGFTQQDVETAMQYLDDNALLAKLVADLDADESVFLDDQAADGDNART